MDHGDESYSVEETDIPMFFDEMMHQLMLEEQEFTDDTGPCMEFLLRHTVLRTCVSLGQGDVRLGLGLAAAAAAVACSLPHSSVLSPSIQRAS